MNDRSGGAATPATGGPRRLVGPVPAHKLGSSLLAGLGGSFVIFVLAELTARFEAALLIAPFGASCVLVFGLPQSPLAQPRNVIGGHLISTLMGLLTQAALGATLLAFGVGVGLAIAAMLLTDTVHPPAGADPIVVLLAGAGWGFLVVPVLTGAMTIVVAGLLFRTIVRRLSRIGGRDANDMRAADRRQAGKP